MPRPSALPPLLVLLPALLAGCAANGGEPDPSAPTPDAQAREDTTSFIIPAGTSLEYKLRMRAGAQVEFSWSAPGPLYYDFHGDREADASGAFTRHKSGTAVTDVGTFTAPFEGRHGWYWENRGRDTLTVTLTTRGEYAVVGIVG